MSWFNVSVRVSIRKLEHLHYAQYADNIAQALYNWYNTLRILYSAEVAENMDHHRDAASLKLNKK